MRTDIKHRLKESAPCVDCMRVLRELNIKKIIYTTNNDLTMISKPSQHVATHETLARRLIKNNGT